VHNVVSGTQTAQALLGTTMPTNQLPTVSFTSTTPTFSYQLPTTGTGSPAAYSTPTITPTRPNFATSTPGRPATYTIHEGESCYCLARRFNVDPTVLISANSSACSKTLQPGTTINIPQTSEWTGGRSLKAHPTNYTVTTGETIFSISCEFGDVDPNILITANALVSPYTLTAGKVIYIP
jgi:LysM repeat protein